MHDKIAKISSGLSILASHPPAAKSWGRRARLLSTAYPVLICRQRRDVLRWLEGLFPVLPVLCTFYSDNLGSPMTVPSGGSKLAVPMACCSLTFDHEVTEAELS